MSMKKIKNISRWPFLLGFLILILAACNKNDVTTTKDAKDGGLIKPLPAFFYKLGLTTQVDISITVPSGPTISEISVYNKFINNDATESNEVLLKTLTGFGSQYTMSLAYADLRKDIVINGSPLPAADTSLPIGSSFVLRYEVKMADDGRKVVNLATTTIGVSNFFAGPYLATGVFHHPTAGDRPLNANKDLVALNAFECWTTVADLGPNGYLMKINVNPTTNLAVVYAYGPTTPELHMTQDKVSKYDPATGVISLYYFYVGGTGNRVIEETFTPVP
ncbi:MAG: hypothetical protein D4R97_04900 [Bacteroidetes bacterium]|nr:MAG: hypothetical protein D4R97_04900 [Bacteroidota bacterium]